MRSSATGSRSRRRAPTSASPRDDVVVAVGTTEGLATMRELIRRWVGVDRRMIVAAGSSDAALAFVEIGALVFGLALLSRLAGRFGLTAIPLYLLAGLAMGEGGFVQLDVTLEFFEIAAEIGVLLLLFTLGLEYSESELRSGLRSGLRPGVVDMTLNALPGVALGLILGLGAAGGGAARRRHVDHLVRGGVEGALRPRSSRLP